MKTFFRIPMVVIALTVLVPDLFAQVEIKGAGSTSATVTFLTKNSNSDTSLLVRDDGRIGIGTSSPTTKLDVNGLVYARNGIQFPDGTIQLSGFPGSTMIPRVFTVAASGANFTTITAAINACSAPTPTNQFQVWVLPGVYVETVNCKKYVHLKGCGKYSTTINGTLNGADSCVIEDFYITKGVVCNGTSPTILHNIITNQSNDLKDGIKVYNTGDPWIKENEILDCKGWGITIIHFGTDPWVIANKILRNTGGGIRCEHSSPTISNNIIDHNSNFGIYMIGAIGSPTEPTIDDNVIGHTDYSTSGIGIYMIGYAEPRIIANDIYLNSCGIAIYESTQPSIIGNNINYNNQAGIRCFSHGASKRVIITGNHIHSSAHQGTSMIAGIWISICNPIISFNNITQNDNSKPPTLPDIDYSSCVLPITNFPTINANVYDIITRSAAGNAQGNFNTNSNGLVIGP